MMNDKGECNWFGLLIVIILLFALFTGKLDWVGAVLWALIIFFGLPLIFIGIILLIVGVIVVIAIIGAWLSG